MIHDRQLRSLLNFHVRLLIGTHRITLNSLITEPVHSIESRIKVLKEMNGASVLKLFNEGGYFEEEIGKAGRIDMLAHGSIEESEAIELLNLVKVLLNFNSDAPPYSHPIGSKESSNLADQGRFIICHPLRPNWTIQIVLLKYFIQLEPLKMYAYVL